MSVIDWAGLHLVLSLLRILHDVFPLFCNNLWHRSMPAHGGDVEMDTYLGADISNEDRLITS